MSRSLLVFLLLLSPICYGSTGVGLVVEVIVYEKENVLVVVIDGQVDEVPSCSDAGRYSYHLDASTSESLIGLFELSMIGNLVVKITGKGECSRGFRSEDVEKIAVGVSCEITNQCNRR